MRTFVAILTIVIGALMVCEAKSQHYIDRSGNYLTSVPNPYYAANGGMMRGATWAHIVADGGREATAQETADWQAAQDAAAQAAANAQAAAEALRGPAPEVFVPMLNSDGEPVGTARLVVIEGSLAVVASTNSASPQKPWAEQKDQILSQLGGIAESKATAAAARLAIKQTVLAGVLAEEDLGQIVDLWPAWAAGVSYAVDEIVRHGGSLYKAVQAHTSQADWTPDVVPALFATITPPGLIAEWVQPTGAQDTYSLGDLVTHVGKTWESTVDNNSWEPGVYGWVEVE